MNQQRPVAGNDYVTRDAFDAGLAGIRTEIADGRTENARQFGELRTEIADGRTENARQFGELRTENAKLRTEIANGHTAQLMQIAAMIGVATAIIGVLVAWLSQPS